MVRFGCGPIFVSSILEHLLSIIGIVGIGRWCLVMRPEATQRNQANDQTYTNHRPLEVEQAVSVARQRETRRKGRFWVPLVLAAIPTVLAIGFGSLRINDLPEQIATVVFIAVLLPAAVICEKLGFGHFNIFSGSTIPDWLLFSVMIALVYVYSLILVVIGRLVVRLLAGWARRWQG